jgi:hypothetical protein
MRIIEPALGVNFESGFGFLFLGAGLVDFCFGEVSFD